MADKNEIEMWSDPASIGILLDDRRTLHLTATRCKKSLDLALTRIVELEEHLKGIVILVQEGREITEFTRTQDRNVLALCSKALEGDHEKHV